MLWNRKTVASARKAQMRRDRGRRPLGGSSSESRVADSLGGGQDPDRLRSRAARARTLAPWTFIPSYTIDNTVSVTQSATIAPVVFTVSPLKNTSPTSAPHQNDMCMCIVTVTLPRRGVYQVHDPRCSAVEKVCRIS